jgi:hypothetical protein
VVDGQSLDETPELAAAFPFVEIISCAPGLTAQLNYGAQQAHAEALWFLHADTTLPEARTVSLILDALQDPEVVGGACRFHLRGDDLYFKFVSSLVNLRARLLGRAYGDQGIFARTAVFRQLSGFRNLPSCSDLDLVLRLRKYGHVRILNPRVETSARTWHQYGKLTTTAFHLREWLTFEWQRALGKKQSVALQP